MVKRQEKQEHQAVGETVNYYHCTACGRNHVPEKEQKKLEQ